MTARPDSLPARRGHGFRGPALALALLAAVACSAPPADPLLPAGLTVTLDHYAGTALTGPLDVLLPPTEPSDCLPIRLRFVAVENVPYDVGFPITAISQIIVRASHDQPIQPVSVNIRGARAAAGAVAEELLRRIESGDWGATEVLADEWTALPGGVTAMAEFVAGDFGVRIDCSRQQTIDGVALDSLTFGIEAGPVTKRAADAWQAERPAELVLLEPTLDRESRVGIILLRALLHDDGPRSLAAIFQFGDVPAAGTEQRELFDAATARALADVSRHAGLVQQRLERMGDHEPGHAQAWADLRSAGKRRAALAFLAGTTSARMAEEVALAGSDAGVSLAARSILESSEEVPPGTDIGWIMERAILFELFESMERGDFPIGLEAALIRHTGAVARLPYLLEELTHAADSLQEFHDSLIEWNTLLLEGRDPADRLRAYDWLRGVTDVPPGYDPLAPQDECREIVRDWIEERES